MIWRIGFCLRLAIAPFITRLSPAGIGTGNRPFPVTRHRPKPQPLGDTMRVQR
ncbi:MAG: hypothetical protein AAGG51_23905 [Cyanobacteria bacterium P01_G01_bin.54]